jgi:hypothetical protein
MQTLRSLLVMMVVVIVVMMMMMMMITMMTVLLFLYGNVLSQQLQGTITKSAQEN